MARRISKSRLAVLTLVVVILVLVGVGVDCNSSSPLGINAPDFTLPTMTGANITLSELEGTPVVINFWSIPCYWCRKQLPYLDNVAQQRGDRLKVIAVNMADNAANIQKFFGEYEPAMVIALDNNREAFTTYCLALNNPEGFIPFTLFVDSQGIIQHVKIGAFASEAALWDTLNNVLGITIP